MSKFYQNLKVKEVANSIGISRNKLFEFLREKKIILKTNGRNIPSDNYIKKKWFSLDYIPINTDRYNSLVPVLEVTPLGVGKITEEYKKHLINQSLEFDEKLKKSLEEIRLDLDLSEDSFKKRVILFHSDNRVKGLYILDLGREEQKDLLKYNKSKKIFEKVWQKTSI